jgi:GntR family transcriptional regulator, transcriptional repressor for pyruvate dehydrogenase complex
MVERDAILFDAIQQTPNLRSELVDTLVARIESGELAPGQRLPTEQEIVNATGVSRTVVREALASLRARGLITTRQGLGAFVTKNPPPKTFSIVPTDLESIDEVLGVLELRMGVEVEAAGLAAKRRTAGDLARIETKLEAIDSAVATAGLGSDEDFAFHRAISAATGNPNFTRLFDTFGNAMIPRQWAHVDKMEMAERERHFTGMGREHRAIFSAIRDGDVTTARRAMRVHLMRSHARFEELRNVRVKAERT